MSREKRKESINGFYQAEVLKNENISYFYDDEDFEFFLELLKKEIIKKDFKIIAYAFLKDNISFIIMTQNFDAISLFMANVLRGYSRYYKKKYGYSDRVFKRRYKLMGLFENEIPDKVFLIHNKLLNSGYDEKKRCYSSFSDYFNLNDDEKICSTDIVYSQISRDKFYIKHYSFHSENNDEKIKEYICNILKTNDCKLIKTVPKKIRNSIVKDLYYNKNVRVCDISTVTGFCRKTIYNIIGKD